MARRKSRRTAANNEPDAVYFLKILLFLILGSIWLKLGSHELLPGIHAIPIGFFIGLVFATHEHFSIDRKVEYAVLLAAAVLSYVAPIGVVIQL